MDTRIALIGVLLETRESVDKLNHLLSDYGEYVIGRMGLPYKEKGIHIISIAVDAPNNIISALSGKLGMLPGVSTKTIYGDTDNMDSFFFVWQSHSSDYIFSVVA